MTCNFYGNFWGEKLHELPATFGGNSVSRNLYTSRVIAGVAGQLFNATLAGRVAQLQRKHPFRGVRYCNLARPAPQTGTHNHFFCRLTPMNFSRVYRRN